MVDKLDRLQEAIRELQDLYDDPDIVTTADKLPPKENPYRDFMDRNPMAGGGMLVEPGFGGVRQGYKDKKLETKTYQKEYYKKNKKLTASGKLAAERDIKLRNFIGKKKTIKASELRPFLEGLGYEKIDYTKIRKKFPNLKIIKDVQTGNPKGTYTKYDKKALNIARKEAELKGKKFDPGIEVQDYEKDENVVTQSINEKVSASLNPSDEMDLKFPEYDTYDPNAEPEGIEGIDY